MLAQSVHTRGSFCRLTTLWPFPSSSSSSSSSFPSPPQERARFDAKLVVQLESWIDQLDASLPPLRNFILPTGGAVGAQLHVARAVCRRLERSLAVLLHQEALDPEVARYINRLSDYLFCAARSASMAQGVDDSPYQKPKPPVE